MMENNEIQIILSERGKKFANVGAFKYRLNRSRKKGELENGDVQKVILQ